jgi:Tfp pilus assembly protein PilO
MKLKVDRRGAIVALAAAVVVIGMGYFVLVAPVRSQGASLAQQLDDARGQLASVASQAAKPAGSQTADKVAAEIRDSKAMPNSTDMPDLLLELDGLARQAGVDFESISPAPAESAGSYQRIPLNAVFGGNFYQLSDFLFRLRNLVMFRNGRLITLGRLIDVPSIEVKADPSTFPRLEATLTLDAFVSGAGTASASGSSQAATTSATDTTSTTTTTSTSSSATPPATTTSAAGGP